MEDCDTTSNLSSLADIPPYLKDQYSPLGDVFQAHPSTLPSKMSAESNSNAVIQSLKALQDKIKQLEGERVVAADRFKLLSTGTRQIPMYKGARESAKNIKTSPFPMQHDPEAHDDLKSRLDTLDERLAVQSLDLDAMQRQLRLSDNSTVPSVGKVSSKQHESNRGQVECTCGCSVTDQKLNTLEQGVVDLREAQSLTKERVQVLEACVDEREGTGSDSTKAGIQRCSSTTTSVAREVKRTVPKKKRKVPRVGISSQHGRGLENHCIPRPIPGVHYRMNMKDIPFIVGSSTTPSHSVSTNYQQVLSLMKSHSQLLCGAAAVSSHGNNRHKCKKAPRSGRIPVRDLKILLAGLEEEFGTLTFEHQAVAHHLRDASSSQNPKIRASLEMQLTQLEDHLKSKSEQIHIVTKQIDSHDKSMMKQRRSKGESIVPTAIKQDVQHTCHVVDVPVTTNTQLCFLKKMKALQSTLQSEDLSWK